LDTHRQHSVGLLWTRDRPVAELIPDNIQCVQLKSVPLTKSWIFHVRCYL